MTDRNPLRNRRPSNRSAKSAAILVFILLLAMGFLLPAAAFTLPGSDLALPEIRTLDVFPELRFDYPTILTNAGDERLFVAEQAGRIWIVKGSGASAEKKIFLDIADIVQDGCEMGLLGLAFHPQYKQNGYFYVNYIVNIEDKYHTRISRFQVTADPDVAAPESELLLMEFEQPYCNHNGGDTHFDPQGMLISAIGDGGAGGDPHNSSQNPQSYLGKLLRIDVDHASPGKNYAIPADNPFIGQAPFDEIWVLGLRNPWRFNFDSRGGDLYIGDVGQNTWEEVNYVRAADAGGQNFGWRLMEGYACFNPQNNCDPGGLSDPVFVYGHDPEKGTCSITGGVVYHGEQMPALDGAYIYADYCSGLIFGLVRDSQNRWRSWQLAEAAKNIVTFGENNQGELYFVSRNIPGIPHDSGKIYRLQAAPRLLLPLVQGR